MKKLFLSVCLGLCLLMSSVAIANTPETTLKMSATESAQFIQNNADSFDFIEEVARDIYIIIFEDGTVIIIIID